MTASSDGHLLVAFDFGLRRIGIATAASQSYRALGPVEVVTRGLSRTWDVTRLTVVSIWKLATGSIPASNIGGPLQISMVAGQQAQQGLVSYALFVALISINLAILNLLPVPMLDGGHLLFFAIEGVLGRPLSVRKREIATANRIAWFWCCSSEFVMRAF